MGVGVVVCPPAVVVTDETAASAAERVVIRRSSCVQPEPENRPMTTRPVAAVVRIPWVRRVIGRHRTRTGAATKATVLPATPPSACHPGNGRSRR